MFDPHSDRTEGYHLFLLPPEPLAGEMQRTIDAFADEFGGQRFIPHVTLLSGIPAETESVLIEKAAQLVQGCTPFELVLGEAGTEDAYFRSLYLQVQQSGELASLHARAADAFGMQKGAAYRPHLSLLYGNYPEERKRAALAALPVADASFVVDRVYLYRTEGRVADWQQVAELSFAADGNA